jgi:four helix bundle protein
MEKATSAKAIKTFKDLEVYEESFQLAMEVFKLTKDYPKEEQYSLTSQMRNAARSVPANIAEGWSKRKHERVFKRQLLDAIGSANEMLVWLDMSLDCGYLNSDAHKKIVNNYEVLGRRLHQLFTKWKNFS